MNESVDIILLTEDRYLNPTVLNDYNQNILLEDRILTEALKRVGISAKRQSWSDPNQDWTKAKYLLFRTTWDYFERFDEFSRWLDQTADKLNTINHSSMIRNNLDKRYLLDLSRKGVEIPETVLLPKGKNIDLAALLESHNFNKAIVKPCISGAARETYVVDNENAGEIENRIRPFLENENFLFQKFEEAVLERGEVSLIYFGGKFTHSILKLAKSGDFRVQDDFGGTVHEFQADQMLIEFGNRVLSALNSIPDYARVDVLWNSDGQPVLSELELIEPELWFRFNPEAADIFARHLKQKYF